MHLLGGKLECQVGKIYNYPQNEVAILRPEIADGRGKDTQNVLC